METITPSPSHAALLDPAAGRSGRQSRTEIDGLAFDAAAAARHLSATTTALHVGLASQPETTVPDGWKADLLARIDAARVVIAELPTPTRPRVAIPAAIWEQEELNSWIREIGLEQAVGVSA
jgi:hypothetical protein